MAYIHGKQCELVTLKLVLYYCIFDRMVLKTVLQGLMGQIYLFMQKEVFFFFFLRSMAYYAFFIEGIEVAWTDKS